MDTEESIHLRTAALDDLTALLAIEKTCFTTDKISPRQMRYHLKRANRLFLVAEVNHKLVGYALMLLPALPRPARLYSMAVLPESHGRGIGKRLLTMLLHQTQQKGYTSCRLEVACGNQAAQAVYQQFGFKAIEDLPRYYADGSDGTRLLREVL